MRKQKLAAVVVGMAMVMSLAACGGGGAATSTTHAGSTAQEISQSAQSQTTEKESEAEKTTEAKTTEAKTTAAASQGVNTSATIEETVLYDENDIKITATELSCTAKTATLSITIENNSEKDYDFIAGSLGYCCNAISGYMVSDGYLNVSVAAGKKANDEIDFSLARLGMYGVTEIADVQIGIDIRDSNYDHFYTGPLKVETSAASSYDYATDTYIENMEGGAMAAYNCTVDYFSKDASFTAGGLTLLSQAVMTNEDGEKAMMIEVENTTDQLLYLRSSDISVNDLLIQPGNWNSEAVNPGTKCIMSMELDSMLDENFWEPLGISKIGQISYYLSVRDSESETLVEPTQLTMDIASPPVTIDTTGKELYNEGGIRVIFKGFAKDDFYDTRADLHMLLLIENQTAQELSVGEADGSLSLNGFMVDCMCFTTSVEAGKYTFLDVEISEDDLAANKIEGEDDIKDAEITLEFRDAHYSSIAEPKLTMTFE